MSQIVEIGENRLIAEFDYETGVWTGVLEESDVFFTGENLEALKEEFRKHLENAEEGEEAHAPHKSPLRSIRTKCLECSGGSSHEVSKCEIEKCPLHPYRFGRNPWRPKRELTEEQRAAMVERLKRGREMRNQGMGDAVSS